MQPADANNSASSPTPAGDPLLIDLAEAARLLSLSAKTAKRMAAAGELPGVVRLRRRVLVSMTALRQWIEKGCPALDPRPGRRR